MITFYQLFHQSPEYNSVNKTQIHNIFKKLALVVHPDKHDNSPESNLLFTIIKDAYDTMIDENKRNQYKYTIDKFVEAQRQNKKPNIPPSYKFDKCPCCKVKLTSLDMVCYNCGHDLYGEALKTPKSTWFCRSCGTINIQEEQCKSCGTFKK